MIVARVGTLVIVCALAACLCFGASAVFQKRGVSEAAPGQAPLPARAIRGVLGNRAWQVGFALEMLGWLAYVACVAVIGGELVAVQPIVGSSIVVTIVLGVALLGERPRRGEWIATAIMGAGGALTVIAQVVRGDAGTAALDPGGLVAYTIVVVAIGLGGGVAVAARTRHPDLAWALIAGACFSGSVMATRLVHVTFVADHPGAFPGVDALALWCLASPAAWVMFVLSWGGFILTQAAYRHGHVSIVEPLIAFTGLVVPSIGGVVAFDEPTTPAALGAGALLVAGFALLIASRARADRG